MKHRPARKHTRFGSIEGQVMLSRRRRAARRARILEAKRLSRIALVEKLVAKINAELGVEETPNARPRTLQEHKRRVEARTLLVEHDMKMGLRPRMASSLRAA